MSRKAIHELFFCILFAVLAVSALASGDEDWGIWAMLFAYSLNRFSQYAPGRSDP